jgi:hypothetical protein
MHVAMNTKKNKMDFEKVLTLTFLHSTSGLILEYNTRNRADVAHEAVTYQKARARVAYFDSMTVWVAWAGILFAAIPPLGLRWEEYPTLWSALCLAIVFTGMIILQAIATPSRRERAKHELVFGFFAKDVIELNDALVASRNMGVSLLFGGDRANMVAFLTNALIEGAKKVLEAEKGGDEEEIYVSKKEMEDLIDSLKPFWGRFDVTSYYDRAENLLWGGIA